jgi:hypothetical protein
MRTTRPISATPKLGKAGFRRRFAKEGGPFAKPTSELKNLHSIQSDVAREGRKSRCKKLYSPAAAHIVITTDYEVRPNLAA